MNILCMEYGSVTHDAGKVLYSADALGSDYLELRDGTSNSSELMGRFCGNRSTVPAFFQTTQNHLRIRSDGQIISFWENIHIHVISDLDQTTLKMILDSNLNMNPLIYPNGPLEWVFVGAISRPQKAFSHRPCILTNIPTTSIVSIASSSLMDPILS